MIFAQADVKNSCLYIIYPGHCAYDTLSAGDSVLGVQRTNPPRGSILILRHFAGGGLLNYRGHKISFWAGMHIPKIVWVSNLLIRMDQWLLHFPSDLMAFSIPYLRRLERFLPISRKFGPSMHTASKHGTPSLNSLPKNGWGWKELQILCFRDFSPEDNLSQRMTAK